MATRSLATLWAVCLLLLIGLSGLAVGIQLLLALSSPAATALDADPGTPSALLFGGIAAYGGLAAAGGVGVFLGRRWAWWIAVATIVAGLAILAAILVAAGPDLVILSGVLIWGVALGLLLVPSTRQTGRS